MNYTADERETIIRTDDASDTLTIYTRQRKMRTKLLKVNSVKVLKENFDEITKVWEDGFYEMPYDRMSFMNLKKEGSRRGKTNNLKGGVIKDV